MMHPIVYIISSMWVLGGIYLNRTYYVLVILMYQIDWYVDVDVDGCTKCYHVIGDNV
jgi:hypothetical protein